MGFEISKDLRFEDCREYGSDSFSSIEFKIVGKKVTQRILEKGGGGNGQNFKARLFK